MDCVKKKSLITLERVSRKVGRHIKCWNCHLRMYHKILHTLQLFKNTSWESVSSKIHHVTTPKWTFVHWFPLFLKLLNQRMTAHDDYELATKNQATWWWYHFEDRLKVDLGISTPLAKISFPSDSKNFSLVGSLRGTRFFKAVGAPLTAASLRFLNARCHWWTRSKRGRSLWSFILHEGIQHIRLWQIGLFMVLVHSCKCVRTDLSRESRNKLLFSLVPFDYSFFSVCNQADFCDENSRPFSFSLLFVRASYFSIFAVAIKGTNESILRIDSFVHTNFCFRCK